MIQAKNVHPKSTLRYRLMKSAYNFTATTTITNAGIGSWIHDRRGKLIDIIYTQHRAGENGTSVTLTVSNAGTTVCTTDAAITLAAGSNKSVDALAKITSFSGGTRPVLKTDSTIYAAKGSSWNMTLTTAGTYSTTFPAVSVTLVFEEVLEGT